MCGVCACARVHMVFAFRDGDEQEREFVYTYHVRCMRCVRMVYIIKFMTYVEGSRVNSLTPLVEVA